MTSDPSKMEDQFHDWLEQCPNSWDRVANDENSATYKFYKNDDDD
tara:strand:+ start:281 stop:415 length:135 start_codon:yes stop_codon:yes gene_type:complete